MLSRSGILWRRIFLTILNYIVTVQDSYHADRQPAPAERRASCQPAGIRLPSVGVTVVFIYYWFLCELKRKHQVKTPQISISFNFRYPDIR